MQDTPEPLKGGNNLGQNVVDEVVMVNLGVQTLHIKDVRLTTVKISTEVRPEHQFLYSKSENIVYPDGQEAAA